MNCIKYFLFTTMTMLLLSNCNNAQKPVTKTDEPAISEASIFEQPYFVTPAGDTVKRVIKSSAEWQKTLTDEAYHILREAGTERAFTGKLLDNKKKGVYTCAACGFPLFSSDTKFKSGTGWPSFYQPINDYAVAELVDESLGMRRVEIRCNRCGGHQGHVFEDGPEPTGLRYCINSLALDFKAEKVKND